MDQKTIEKYLNGMALPEERKEVLLWIESSTENKENFLKYRKLYDLTVWNMDPVQIKSSNKRNIPTLMKYFSGAAAVLLVCFLGIRLLLPLFSDQPESLISVRTITCPPGQRSELVLADGTKIWLNSNSSIRLLEEKDRSVRTIELNGEAYFKVHPDKAHPFVVKTKQHDITVLGTSFNVFSYNNSTLFECSLLEGSVSIKNSCNNEETVLKPNEKLQVKNGVAAIMNIDTDANMWIKGIYAFKNKPLCVVFEHLALLHEVSIELQNTQVGEQMCTGKFRNKDGIDYILSTLQKKYHFKYAKNETNSYVIY